MNRNLVLAVLVASIAGAIAWVGGWLGGWLRVGAKLVLRRRRDSARGRGPRNHGGPPTTARTDEGTSGQVLERRLWRRVWVPLLPSVLAAFALGGWALQEPGQTDEIPNPLVLLLALPVAVGWLRACARALRSLLAAGAGTRSPLVTVGLLRPRVVCAVQLRDVLDSRALDAAMAHEAAHVRHRDPLRVWLAQLATDLQWPNRDAQRRLRAWLSALELARDEEARRSGTPGEDLAAAVLAVTRLVSGRPPGAPAAAACLTGAELDLATRIRRLLAPLRPPCAPPSRAASVVLASMAVVALFVGFEAGDAILHRLPFVRTNVPARNAAIEMLHAATLRRAPARVAGARVTAAV